MSMDQPALPERHPSSDQPGVEIERRAQLEINPGAVALRLMGLPNMLSPDEFAKADELLKSVIGFGVNELAFFGRVQHDEHRENNSLRMANKALEAESAQDRVTGALTQKGLEHAVFEAAIEAVLENKPMFAAYADLDKFKEVNDSLGARSWWSFTETSIRPT